MKNRRAILTLAIGLVSSMFSGCHDGARPTLLVAAEAHEAAPSEYGRVVALTLPRAVFRTTPGANAAGTIFGGSPLTVKFNLCQSRPASEDDSLKFTYDFDGDGHVDFFGHCRAEHVYENSASARACVPARVCVSDRRPDGEVCQGYEVCLNGGATEPAPRPRGDGDDDGDPTPGGAPNGNDFDLEVARGLPAITGAPGLAFDGILDPVGDEDYFRVVNPLSTTAHIVIVLCSPSSTARLRLVQRDANGGLIRSDDMNCWLDWASFDLAGGETRFLGVLAENDDPAGIECQLKFAAD